MPVKMCATVYCYQFYFVNSASEMTYIVSSGALNSTQSVSLFR